ncbi:MAG: flagellar hook-basal body complex protein FliE [Oscillospiraceae bacterium]|nr:flagellar hook-basal body complex protein FliE [Oscillospiraceae bacterium]
MSMQIIPLGSFPPIVRGGGPGLSPTGEAAPQVGGVQAEIPFQSLFTQALAHVNETQAIAQQDSINLALGQIDDIGQMNVNSARAGIAFDLMLQVRNRVLEAYQEMMRMNV